MEINSTEKVELLEKTRLDKWLTDNFADWSRSQIKLQIESGGVFVNGKQITKAGFIIKDGDVVLVKASQGMKLIEIVDYLRK